MSKTDLIEFVAEKAELSKAAAGRAVDAFMEGVTKGLVKDVADLKTSSEKVNTTLFGDETGTNQGLVKTVGSLQTEMVEISNKVNILDGRLKWQDINETE